MSSLPGYLFLLSCILLMVFVVGYWFHVSKDSNVFTLEGKVCTSSFGNYFTVTFFNIRCDTKLDREQIFALHWGRSEALCNKEGSHLAGRQLWGILASLGVLFCAGSDVFEGEQGVAFFRGSIEHIEASSFVISHLHTFHEHGA